MDNKMTTDEAAPAQAEEFKGLEEIEQEGAQNPISTRSCLQPPGALGKCSDRG